MYVCNVKFGSILECVQPPCIIFTFLRCLIHVLSQVLSQCKVLTSEKSYPFQFQPGGSSERKS